MRAPPQSTQRIEPDCAAGNEQELATAHEDLNALGGELETIQAQVTPPAVTPVSFSLHS